MLEKIRKFLLGKNMTKQAISLNYPRILPTSPCGRDLLQGGAHQSIADTIAEDLKNSDNIKMIGLDGGWGSGKSNVIKLLESSLKEGKDKKTFYHVCIYDAWQHINDEQRRSIIEDTTEYLCREAGFNKENLENASKEAQTSTVERKEKSQPLISPTAMLLIMMMSIAPLYYTLSKIVTWNFSICSSSYKIVDVLTTILYFILFLLFIFFFIKDWKNLGSFYKAFSALFSVRQTIIQQQNVKEHILRLEPNSLSFRAWMQYVDEQLKRKGEKLILVFDNMDRLPQEKVKELWATIQTFFPEEKKYEYINIVVPFDRNHIVNAFKDEDVSTFPDLNKKDLSQLSYTKPDNENSSNNSSKIKKINSPDYAWQMAYGNDFINKTFDVVYRVAPPVLNGWKQLIHDLWHEAFGEDNTISEETLRVFDALQPKKSPRNIIAFINEIVTVIKTRTIGHLNDEDNKIPMNYIALYILGKHVIDNNPMGEILSPSFLGNIDFLYRNDVNFPKYISSLYYQVSFEVAKSSIIIPQLKDDFENGHVENIIEAIGNENLAHSVDNALEQVQNIGGAVTTLDHLEKEMGRDLTDYWTLLCRLSEKISYKKDKYYKFHSVLLRHFPNKAKFINDRLSGYAEGGITGNINNEVAENYKIAIDQFKLNVDPELVAEIVSKKRVGLNPDVFIHMLDICKDTYTEYGFDCNLSGLDEYLSALDNNSLVAPRILPYILHKGELEELLPKYTKHLEQLIKSSTANVNIDEVSGYVERLKELKYIIDVQYDMDDSTLVSLYRRAKENKTDDTCYLDFMAMYISKLQRINRSSAMLAEVETLEGEDKNLLALLLEKYTTYGDLLENADVLNNGTVTELIGFLTDNTNTDSKLDFKSALLNFDKFCKDLELKEKALYKKICSCYNDKEQVDGLIKNMSSLSVSLITCVLEISDNQLSTVILQLLEEKFNQMSQGEWKDACLSKSNIVTLWYKYHPHLLSNQFDAVKEILKDCVKQDGNLPDMNSLVEIAAEQNIEETVSFFDDLIRLPGINSNSSKVFYFGRWMLKYVTKGQNASNVIKFFATETIDDNVVSLLLMNCEELKLIKKHFTKAFKEKLQSLLNISNSNGNDINKLCFELNIKLPESRGEKDKHNK